MNKIGVARLLVPIMSPAKSAMLAAYENHSAAPRGGPGGKDCTCGGVPCFCDSQMSSQVEGRAELNRMVKLSATERAVISHFNVSESEVLAFKRRQRVDALCAAALTAAERGICANMMLTPRDVMAQRFTARFRGPEHAAVAVEQLIKSARGILSAAPAKSWPDRDAAVVTAQAFIGAAVMRRSGLAGFAIRGAGGREAIRSGRDLAAETHRKISGNLEEADVNALLGEALQLLEEVEGKAGDPESFKKIAQAGGLIEMLLDEITPAYTALHPEAVGGGDAVDENFTMPPSAKMAVGHDGLTDAERPICAQFKTTPAEFLAAKAARRR